MFCQDPLTTERTIPILAPIRIPAHITVRMTHVVAVFLVELVVSDFGEAACGMRTQLIN
jgi:hypothetical protein